MKRVYVAGPYSADNVMDVFGNMRRGMIVAEKIFAAGYAPFVPWHDYHFEMRAEHCITAYYEYSMAWLEVSDCVVLVDGWEKSKGTLDEIRRADELGITVYRDLDTFLAVEGIVCQPQT